MAATIELEGIGTFEITFDSHRESYRNEITQIQSRKSTNPGDERWAKGQIQPINVELIVVAGVTPSLATGADVVRLASKAMGRAIQRQAGRAPSRVLNETTIKIGNWYERVCLVTDCDVEFMAPWDAQSQPMQAKIALVLQVIGAKHQPGKDNYSFKRQAS